MDVKVDGFATFRAERLVLAVGQDRELDVSLTLRAVQETVVVAEPGHVITTTVDGVVDATRIESLPLNGRNFLELSLLVPGNQPTPTFDPTKTNSVPALHKNRPCATNPSRWMYQSRSAAGSRAGRLR